MSKRFITGEDFMQMVFAAADRLHQQVNRVNALNVFPVPDGDTGTNMNLTLRSGVEELRRKPSAQIGKAAEVLSKGLLMGARGNSGVILSQLFRGFAKAASGADQLDANQLAAALQQGVDTAYQAVVKPVEGTILTVSKEAAKHAVQEADHHPDVAELMREVVRHAGEALARTPDLLPVLKQVGVVDAGGQGLVIIYEGFASALGGEESTIPAAYSESQAREDGHRPIEELNLAASAHGEAHARSAQSQLATEDIAFGYCTEFMVKLNPRNGFEEAGFRRKLSEHGDSLLVVADDDLVKVHIHAEYPGNVMNLAMQFGQLSRIKIENMRDQHIEILERDMQATEDDKESVPTGAGREQSRYGIVTVAAGDGIADIFSSIGVDYILSGGQTMNPSTEDILGAVRKVGARTVFVLPNNANIILAAEQARELADCELIVIPTKTIPQGIAAALAFNETAEEAANAEAMRQAIGTVRSGQVTYAVRDTEIDGLTIKQGDYLGLVDNKLVSSLPDQLAVCTEVLDRMLAGGGDVVTALVGSEADEAVTASLAAYLQESYPDFETEIHHGGQPLYYYIFSVD